MRYVQLVIFTFESRLFSDAILVNFNFDKGGDFICSLTCNSDFNEKITF
jgi:hypothetical protein